MKSEMAEMGQALIEMGQKMLAIAEMEEKSGDKKEAKEEMSEDDPKKAIIVASLKRKMGE